MDLYTCETLIDLASKFYNEENVRLRNVQGWIHPHTKAKKRNTFSKMASRPRRFQNLKGIYSGKRH